MRSLSRDVSVYRWNGCLQYVGLLLGKRSRFPFNAKIPSRALVIWRERPDLQAEFDLSQENGRESLLLWYLHHGFNELGLFASPDDRALIDALGSAVPQIDALAFVPVSWLIFLSYPLFERKSKYMLRQKQGQDQLLSWFFARYLDDANLSPFLTVDQANALLAPAEGSRAEDTGQRGGRLLQCIWTSTPELQERFSGPCDPAFRNWCLSKEGLNAFPILTHPMITLAPPPVRSPIYARPFGVNLFGHAHARSGVSEDMRMACLTLQAAGIPFVIRNVSPGATMAEEDVKASDQANTLPYAINMFCMSPSSTIMAAMKAGRAEIADYHSIGFWPWELPEWPVFWKHAYQFVDEVWTSSRFTSAAFRRSSPHPVLHIPFAVDASESGGLTRSHFGLPEDAFLFGFAFDGLSGFARKSPLSTLKAFQRAFPKDDKSVGLVIKGLRTDSDPAWHQLLQTVADDDRICFITSSLTRESLLDLWRALDCFVSLHRSEGFGRNIAETMLVGTPVIVTAHSGNMDFTTHDTAALVSCVLRHVKEGEYPFGAGQLWAEPDIDIASHQMRRMVKDHQWRKSVSTEGRAFIENNYNIDIISKIWKHKLENIYYDSQ